MKKSVIGFSALFACLVTSAHANWQYSNNYKRDSWAGDDGMRFILSVRGGAALGKASIQNDIGGLTGTYMVNSSNNDVVPLAWWNAQDSAVQALYDVQTYGSLGDLPPAQEYKEYAVMVGVSAGFTMPRYPQWRIEFGLDHISETDYNPNPLFDGMLPLAGGYYVEAQSGGVQSTLSSDIYSIMAFHDFFDGLQKPLYEFIPYIGVGLGYGDTLTVLQLTDSYGELSSLYDLQNFGIVDSSGIIQFHKAETHSSNLVPMLAGGFSYGIGDRMFLDAGVRLMYMNKIKWQLTNGENTTSAEKRRDWFSADKMLYVAGLVGLRVEF